MSFFEGLIIFNSLSFFGFGWSCLSQPYMVAEFNRYGLTKYRRLVAYLEILAALGLLAGLSLNPVLLIASGGLSLLMLMGFVVRLKIQDGFWRSFPAAFYMLVSLYIFLETLR